MYLQAHARWVLSGTPDISGFAAVSETARWLGVHLGAPDAADGPSAVDAVEWVQFELHPSFKEHTVRVRKAGGVGGRRFEVKKIGWGTFEVELQVKLEPPPPA